MPKFYKQFLVYSAVQLRDILDPLLPIEYLYDIDHVCSLLLSFHRLH